MQLTISLIGVGLLLMVALMEFKRTRHDPHRRTLRDSPLSSEEMIRHIKLLEPSLQTKGQARLALPRDMRQALHRARKQFSKTDTKTLLPAAQWLCDHMRRIEEALQSVQYELKSQCSLPKTRDGSTRIMKLANEMVSHSGGLITKELCIRCLNAYYQVCPLSQKELYAFPLALKTALLTLLSEMLSHVLALQKDVTDAQRTAHALLHKHSVNQNRLKMRSTAFWEKLLSALKEADDSSSATWIHSQLKRLDLDAIDLVQTEHLRQSENRHWVANAIHSLKMVEQLPWQELLEEHNPIHNSLLKDASGTYARMDFESRQYYCFRVQRLCGQMGVTESALAQAACQLSREQKADGVHDHAGYYLLEPRGEKQLKKALKIKRLGFSCHLWFKEHARGLYRLCLFLWTVLTVLALIYFRVPFLMSLGAVILSTQMIRYLIRFGTRRLLPVRLLPRMQIENLKADQRTLVVIPTLMTSPAQALSMARQLSVLHHANPDKQLHFMLLSDFKDSDTQSLLADDDIVRAGQAAISALSQQIQNGTFYFVQRGRTFNPKQSRYIGRERKRGALEMLNCYLTGRENDDPIIYTNVDLKSLTHFYSYVITLDSDTILPPGSAKRLIGAISHPLQIRRKIDGQMRGMSIIAPRMEVSAATVSTPISFLWGGSGGVDPYNSAISDLYQDIACQGSFTGKGIYTPDTFMEAVENDIRPNSVLSHDLLEGELTGCGLAGDIVLYDGHPKTLEGFLKRQHRWVRGDWQLLPWLLPFPPGQVKRTPLSTFSRHKIWDNLLRSLVPIARLMLLLLSAYFKNPWLFALGVLATELEVLLAPSYTGLLVFITRLAFLPLEAFTMGDAILRTLHRVFISHRHMLDWVTAAQGDIHGNPKGFDSFIQYAGGGLMLLLCLISLPQAAYYIPLAVLFALAPFSMKKLNGPLEKKESLSEEDRSQAMELAGQTFQFFQKLVTEETHFLPPDNLQLHPDKGLAHRTSPTNIGLYLLSLVAGHELGFMDADEMGRQIAHTMDTLEHLEKWQGHLYNWYDTKTLEPLPPYFISSVDSGNLMACLLTVSQALRTLAPNMDTSLHSLSARVDELAERTDLSALFDQTAQLFHIGFDTKNQHLTKGHYDLLASESRLLSFVAIMTKKVPIRHWSRLGRTLIRFKGHVTLISWSGTMFEYLMPHLLLPYIRGTLLSDGAKGAFAIQARYQKAGVFGVSESGYYAFDPALNYQYKAFGLPALALSGEVNAEVIAPYASLLAFPLYPARVSANLRAMIQKKWHYPMGLYEAVDFDPNRVGQEPYQIVKSQMAHHQGMILCALCNGLKDNALQKYFFALPQAKAYELLLEERAPGFVFKTRPKKMAATKGTPPVIAMREAQVDTAPVDAHLMYGGGTTLMVDAMGSGYMQNQGVMLSRFRDDSREKSGIRFYVKDPNTNEIMLLTDPDSPGKTTFYTGKAIFQRKFPLFESQITYFVNPIDGAALHLIELTNPSGQEIPLELCDYFELSLNGQKADMAHPAFGDLFIETGRLGKFALTARRRPKDGTGTGKICTHALIAEGELMHTILQTDRGAFIGRNGGVSSPLQLSEAIERSAGFVGPAINPCMSIRARVLLPAHEKLRFLYVTHYDHEQKCTPAAVLERYQSIAQSLHILDLSQTQGLVTMRHLALSDFFYNLFGRLSGALLYSRPQIIEEPCSLGIEGLWSLGISGDLPLLTVLISKREHMALVKTALSAHSLYAMQGFWVDLALVIKELPAYDRPLHSTVADAVTLSGQPQNVHIIEESVHNPDHIQLLKTFSRLVLKGEDGSLAAQLQKLIQPAEEKTAPPIKQSAPALPKMDRLFFNGFGGFTPTDYDYAIDLINAIPTPAPWSNMLCTKEFGSLVTESGFGFSYFQNSHNGRITPFYNDPIQYHSGERITLYDREMDSLFSPTLMPYGQALNHRCTHSMGVTTYFSIGLGYECSLTVFTDEEYPVSVRQLRVKNTLPQTRHLSIAHEVDFMMGTEFKDGQLVSLQKEGDLLIASQPDFPALCFISCLAPNQNPMETTLKADQLITVTYLLGAMASREQIRQCVDVFLQEGITKRLRGVQQAWQLRVGNLRFSLPDEKLNILMNKWLPYQVLSSRLFARAGFYQAGGAIGFRDQLQDMVLLMHTDPAAVRAHLINCAAHQYEQGDVQHWWHPERKGVRTRISDDLLFLPYLTAWYVKRTGDETILSTEAPYLSAPELSENQQDLYHTPDMTFYQESLMAHCLKAISRVRFGPNGIPLMQGGDWNDGMSTVGGESIWLGLFMAAMLKDFAPLCDNNEKQALLNLRDDLLKAIDDHGWDGDWYLRAYYENGEALGSQSASACQIDSLSQSWAVLSGIRRDRAAQGLNEAYQRLYLSDIGVMQLLTPPFEPLDKAGYIAGYLPGIRENGGQYTHAVPWVIWAMKELGWKDRALDLLNALLPINHSLDIPNALRYRLEPYFMAGDIYTNQKQYGRGGWSMYTGSAAWLYTIVLEQILGFTKVGNSLKLKPFVPEAWEDFSITFFYGQSTWHITASKDVVYPTLDGEKLTGGALTLIDDHRIHDARFRISPLA